MSAMGGLFALLQGNVEKLKQETLKIGREISDEAKRLGVQGAAELGGGLFSQSNAYVPYGRGQNPVSAAKEADGPNQGAQQNQAPQKQLGRGREM